MQNETVEYRYDEYTGLYFPVDLCGYGLTYDEVLDTEGTIVD